MSEAPQNYFLTIFSDSQLSHVRRRSSTFVTDVDVPLRPYVVVRRRTSIHNEIPRRGLSSLSSLAFAQGLGALAGSIWPRLARSGCHWRPCWLDLASFGSIWLPLLPWLARFGCSVRSWAPQLARFGCRNVSSCLKSSIEYTYTSYYMHTHVFQRPWGG